MKIRILDTTLRDGEQSPGVALRPEGKVEIARLLDKLRVDAIEAGFPAVSAGEKEASRRIARMGLRAEVCGLARTETRDIDAVLDSGIRSVHIFMATSDVHLKHKLMLTRDDVLRRTDSAVAYAKRNGMQVEFSAEDATRTDPAFLKKVFSIAEQAGADRVDIPDTVGRASPARMAATVRDVASAVRVPISVHCHNDLGLASANSMSAIEAGARCVHVTVNGVGERAGNASLEEVVAILRHLHVRGNPKTGIDARYLYEASLLVSRLFGMQVQPNKAIVGANAFSHESGIHTHGIVNNPKTYSWIDPAEFGRSTVLVNGKHSGIHGTRAVLERYGVFASDEALRQIVARVKSIGDSGGHVSDESLLAIAGEVMGAQG